VSSSGKRDKDIRATMQSIHSLDRFSIVILQLASKIGLSCVYFAHPDR